MSYASKSLQRRRTFKYKLLLEALVIGAVTGLLIALFRLGLEYASQLRGRLVETAHSGTGGALVAAAVLLVIAIAVAFLLEWEPEATGSGIPQVEGEMRGLVEHRWWSVILAKFAGCTLAIGGGLALGREGPSIQLGSMVGKGFARAGHRVLTEERLLITCGAGAGLSAAFGAPLAGAIFALEELQKNFSVLILVTTMAATAVSDYVVAQIVGLKPVFNIEITHSVPLRLYWAVLLLGILIGLMCVVYNRTLAIMQDVFDRIASLFKGHMKRISRIVAAFVIAYSMYFAFPGVLGSGAEYVVEIASGKYMLGALVVLLLVKFLYSTSSFGSGAPGGIFLPLLVLGAIIGGVYCRTLGVVFGVNQDYMTAFVVMAMTGFLSGIVRAPATGIILITEMTSDFHSLLALVVVSLTATVVAEALGAQPVYEQLLDRRLKAEGKAREAGIAVSEAEEEDNVKVILKGDVHIGAFMDGTPVREMSLPAGCLIVSVTRRGTEMVPYGDTVLEAGDHIEILCRKALIDEAIKVIRDECEVNI